MPRGRSVLFQLVILAVLAATTVACGPGWPPHGGGQRPGTISTVAGSLGVGRSTAIAVSPGGLAAHGSSVYVGDNAVIRRVDVRTGRQRVIAGTGHVGWTGDGAPATETLMAPGALDVDPDGNVVFIDNGSAVRRIDRRTGMVEMLFGAPPQPPSSDGLAGADLAVDRSGNIYVTEGTAQVVRWDAATDTTSVVAGSGGFGFSGDGGPATEAQFQELAGVAVDDAGNLYIADQRNMRVRRVDTAGIVTTVAGTGDDESSGDGGPATAAGIMPSDLAIADDGDLLVVELYGHRVRRVDRETGLISTDIGAAVPGFSGDGGPARDAQFARIGAIAVNRTDGSVAVADEGNARVRRVDDTSGTVSTIAGTGGTRQSGDGGRATRAQIIGGGAVAVDSRDNLYLVDGQKVRRVDRRTREISTVVGGRSAPGTGDGGPAVDASLASPTSLVFDRDDNLYIADAAAYVVRRVDARTGVITTVAGNGEPIHVPVPDGTPATDVALGGVGLAVADDGALLIAAGSGWIYRLGADGRLEVVVTDSLAIGTPLPDGHGGLYISDAHRVERMDLATGTVTPVAGGGAGPVGDGGPATEATLDSVIQLALGSDGALFIAEVSGNRVRRVDPATGIISTVAGTGDSGPVLGDGGPAVRASLHHPGGLTIDSNGDLYVSEQLRIRKVTRVAPPG